MATTIEELIKASERWLFEEQDEVCLRASASRSYYAAFHTCHGLQSHLSKGLQRSGGVHEGLISALLDYVDRNDQELSKKVNSLGWMMKSIRNTRTKADYYLDSPFSRSDAETVLQSSRKIADRVQEISHAIASNQI